MQVSYKDSRLVIQEIFPHVLKSTFLHVCLGERETGSTLISMAVHFVKQQNKISGAEKYFNPTHIEQH